VNENDLRDLESLLAWSHKGISNSFFSTGVGPNPKDSDHYILHVSEGGLGLGDRDFYLEKNENNEKILKAYERYVKRLMELIGYSPEEQERVWNNVISIETELAKNKMPREKRRDPLALFNMRTIDELEKSYPNINWRRYFSCIGLENIERVNVMSPDYMAFLNLYLPSLTKQQIKDLLIYDIVSDSSSLLSDDFIDANFEMYGKVMSGREQKKPRWKRVMAIPNSMFGEAVGQLYVEKYFPKENKEYMLNLVGNLKNSLADHIRDLKWMSETTKNKALEKLDTLVVKIGYPDKWKDYSGIEIDPSKSYLENVYKASVWYTEDNYKKLNKQVDKTEWFMTPQTVNAYYSPTSNEICFPAAILQPPYFDLSADDAINYGGIGVVIGHEMTHGFDDQGRQYDKNGNLQNWWCKEDEENFKKLTKVLEEQFNKIEVAPGVYANGKFTLGENIADQGGLRVSLSAYLNTLKESEEEIIDGFSPLQRFYLSYANVWADNIRQEEILVRTKTDPHSLGKNRVNATLRNLAPFFDAFGIKAGDKMFLPEDERVIIW
ncbi:MAG: M13 family metallopeptidase, partial [Muribaculaceae bacterium]|nr:M13 family metallopeptidase [Muribaculaceae bacterium]